MRVRAKHREEELDEEAERVNMEMIEKERLDWNHCGSSLPHRRHVTARGETSTAFSKYSSAWSHSQVCILNISPPQDDRSEGCYIRINISSMSFG